MLYSFPQGKGGTHVLPKKNRWFFFSRSDRLQPKLRLRRSDRRERESTLPGADGLGDSSVMTPPGCARIASADRFAKDFCFLRSAFVGRGSDGLRTIRQDQVEDALFCGADTPVNVGLRSFCGRGNANERQILAEPVPIPVNRRPSPNHVPRKTPRVQGFRSLGASQVLLRRRVALRTKEFVCARGRFQAPSVPIGFGALTWAWHGLQQPTDPMQPSRRLL